MSRQRAQQLASEFLSHNFSPHSTPAATFARGLMMKFQVLGVAGLVGKRFELDRIVTTEEAHTVTAIAR